MSHMAIYETTGWFTMCPDDHNPLLSSVSLDIFHLLIGIYNHGSNSTAAA